MPTVTGLAPDVRGSGGVTVHLDGASFALVAAADVRALRLEVGAVLSAVAVAEVERRSEVFGARAAALRILSYRPLPAGELERRLVRKGHVSAVAREALASLAEAGLVNDDEFARHYVRTRARRLRHGPGRLERDLCRLGIGAADARRAVEAALAEDGVDPRALLREAAAKKVATLGGLDRRQRGRRLATYLRRRGFAAADINEVVKEALAG
jgi:regulatory protein